MASLYRELGGESGFGEYIVSRGEIASINPALLYDIFQDDININGRNWILSFLENYVPGVPGTFGMGFDGSGSLGAGTKGAVFGFAIGGNAYDPISGLDDDASAGFAPSSGGTSTGTGLVYYDFDFAGDRFIATWDDVPVFADDGTLLGLNAYQMVWADRGNGDIDVRFIYESTIDSWEVPHFSLDINGASGGYSLDIDTVRFADLDTTVGNTGEVGIWEFHVRDGIVTLPTLTPNSDDVQWTLFDVNDWYNSANGRGGFIAYFDVVIPESVGDDGVRAWEIATNYTGAGTQVRAWTTGHGAQVNAGDVLSDGGFGLSTDGIERQILLDAGETIRVGIRADGAGFDENDFELAFSDLDPELVDPLEALVMTNFESNLWADGLNQYITFTNTSESYLNGWTLRFDAPDDLADFEIVNFWGADMERSESGDYLFSSSANDELVAAGDSVSFGFKAAFEAPGEAFEFHADNFIVAETSDGDPLPLEFELLNGSAWDGGLNQKISVTNTGSSRIAEWMAEYEVPENFDLSLRKVSGAASGGLDEDGDILFEGAALNAGATKTFFLSLDYEDTNSTIVALSEGDFLFV